MEQYRNKIFFFADLDDSLFQTIRKDENGKFKATYPKNVLKTSFYTKAQYNLLNFILANNEIVFIPLTARTKEQFERTKIFKTKQASIYAFYYGSTLYINNREYLPYTKKVIAETSNSFAHLSELIDKVKKRYPTVEFINVDQKYYTSQINNKDVKKFIINLINKKYNDLEAYVEEKYITILPKVYNKSTVVKYLTNKFKPKMTLGIGNSVSDIDFLNHCDFKIISHIGMLDNKLNS
jgi:hypothetical protein